jgi:hypothetical protein
MPNISICTNTWAGILQAHLLHRCIFLHSFPHSVWHFSVQRPCEHSWEWDVLKVMSSSIPLRVPREYRAIDETLFAEDVKRCIKIVVDGWPNRKAEFGI